VIGPDGERLSLTARATVLACGGVRPPRNRQSPRPGRAVPRGPLLHRARHLRTRPREGRAPTARYPHRATR
jgi:hypothetical protein